MKEQSEKDSQELSSKQLSNLIKFPHILYSLKFKYSNLIFKVKDANSEIEIDGNSHSNVSNLLYDIFEDIWKTRFCFKVNEDFKWPSMLLYNCLLHLKTSKEKNIEVLYDKRIYKVTLNSIKENGKKEHPIENCNGNYILSYISTFIYIENK